MGDQVRYDCEVTIDKFYKNIYHIYMGALMVYVDTLDEDLKLCPLLTMLHTLQLDVQLRMSTGDSLV